MFRWQQFSSAATIWPGRSSRPAAACDALRKFSRQQSRARRRVVGDSASVNAATVALVRRSRLEAVLFVAREPLSLRKLAQLANLADGTEARTVLNSLRQRYDARGCAF